MCEICYMSRCPSGCPNAPDPPAITICCRCGELIVHGDEYACIDGKNYCEICIGDIPYRELIPMLGGEWKMANEEDIYDGYDG